MNLSINSPYYLLTFPLSLISTYVIFPLKPLFQTISSFFDKFIFKFIIFFQTTFFYFQNFVYFFWQISLFSKYISLFPDKYIYFQLLYFFATTFSFQTISSFYLDKFHFWNYFVNFWTNLFIFLCFSLLSN